MPIMNLVATFGGDTPTGTANITSNGTYNVAQYANANVNVPVPDKYLQLTTSSGKLVHDTTASLMDFTGITDVGDYVLHEAYKNNALISGALNLSSLTTLSGNTAMGGCFSGCTNLTSADLSNLTTLSANYAMKECFMNCTGLTSVDLSNLTTLSGNNAVYYCFENCTNLTSIDLSNLTTLSGWGAMQQCFRSCTSLTTVTIGGTTAINFGSNKNQFSNMFNNCTQNITLNIATDQATLSQFTDYPNFGCTGTVTINYTAQ